MADPNDADEHAEAEGSERRGEDRAAITLKVDYKRLNTFFADYTRNISKGGTFIRTNKPLEVGTRFVFELTVPEPGVENTHVRLELTGEVKWVVPPAAATDESAAGPAGMGIKFVFETDEERQRVERFVADLMRASLGDRLTEKLLSRG